jgi:hypothetical protein
MRDDSKAHVVPEGILGVIRSPDRDISEVEKYVVGTRPSLALQCNGPCDVVRDYNGENELLVTRILSALTVLSLLIFLCWNAVRTPA